jgi:beta-galactosidase
MPRKHERARYMKMTNTRRNMSWALTFALAVVLAGTQARSSAGASFAVGEQDFLLDGKPLQIRAGELHYSRIPREYWPHRLRMAHALGLNALTVSLFWNLHEPEPGHCGRDACWVI